MGMIVLTGISVLILMVLLTPPGGYSTVPRNILGTPINCQSVPGSFKDTVTRNLAIPQGGSVRNLRAVQFGNKWFVGGDLQGQGFEGMDDVAVWLTADLNGKGKIYAANSTARSFSHYNEPESRLLIGPGVRSATLCVTHSQLSPEPGTPQTSSMPATHTDRNRETHL